MVPVGKPRKYASVRLASGHRKAPPVVIRPAVTAVLNATVKPAGEDNEAATEVAERSASAAAGSFTETTKAEERTPLIPLATAWSFQARSRTDDTGYGERLVRLRASASDNRLHRLKLDRYDRRGKGLLGGHPGTILPPKTRPAPRRPASASAKSLPSRDKPLTAASLAAFNEQQDKAAGVEPTPPATPIVSQNMFTLVKPPPSGTFGTSPRKDEPPPPGSPHSKRPNSASPHSGRSATTQSNLATSRHAAAHSSVNKPWQQSTRYKSARWRGSLPNERSMSRRYRLKGPFNLGRHSQWMNRPLRSLM